jgi:methylphosphotriester-DNA--protein-cysteine methyltransferase
MRRTIGLRDTVGDFEESTAAVIARAAAFASGPAVPRHVHARGQLAVTFASVMRVEAAGRLWLAPYGGAVWLPARIAHRSISPNRRAMRSLYVRGREIRGAPDAPFAVSADGPLGEMVRWLADAGEAERATRAWAKVASAALALVRPAPGISVRLPVPRHPKLVRLAEAILADPGDARSLDEWGRMLAASPRTLLRAVRREIGMSYREWRSHLALIVGAERVLAGASVTTSAFDAGYASASSFIAAFRRAFGAPPGVVLRNGRLDKT